MEDYYQILGVKSDVTLEELKRRYRFLAQAYHPDRFNTLEAKAEAENDMKRINAAYDVLSNPSKRTEYDRNYRNQYSKSGQPSSQTTDNSRLSFETHVAYLDAVGKRWLHLANRLGEISSYLAFRDKVFDQSMRLVSLAYPAGSREYGSRAQRATDEINWCLTGMMFSNVVLGAEIASYKLKPGLDKNALEMITTMPLLELVLKLVEAAEQYHSIPQPQSQRMLDELSHSVFELCLACQRVGADLSTRTPQAVRSATPNSGPPSSGYSSWHQVETAQSPKRCSACLQSLPVQPSVLSEYWCDCDALSPANQR
jgi:curved DNA-binding protein CbpA